MTEVSPPFSLLAEVTHRCPLHCPYCYNPVELAAREAELTTAEWLDVLDQAAAMGVVQVHLSGGEPLARHDLEQLVERAHQRGCYTNLITSGVSLSPERARRLAGAGLDSLQLSIQAATPELADRIAGRRSWEEKRRAARAVREAGLPLNLNVVLHRLNIDQLDSIIAFACELGAERLELANTQYYGWALVNRAQLMPSREQVERAYQVYRRWRERLDPGFELIWVVPDQYEAFPKPCMGGWGRLGLTVAPDGTVLPCPAASIIHTLQFHSIREKPLDWIWYRSPSFNAFRGTEWMREPCRSCERRFQDFGGCRCQAFALTGDAAATDPVCQWSPHHHVVTEAVAEAGQAAAAAVAVQTRLALTYRKHRGSWRD